MIHTLCVTCRPGKWDIASSVSPDRNVRSEWTFSTFRGMKSIWKGFIYLSWINKYLNSHFLTLMGWRKKLWRVGKMLSWTKTLQIVLINLWVEVALHRRLEVLQIVDMMSWQVNATYEIIKKAEYTKSNKTNKHMHNEGGGSKFMMNLYIGAYTVKHTHIYPFIYL